MGWFLSEKSKTKRKPGKRTSKAKGKAKAAATGRWDPAVTRYVLKSVLALFCVAAIGGMWAWGEKELRASVSDGERQDPVIQLHGQPSWMPAVVSEDLVLIIMMPLIESDLFDQTALVTAANRLIESPWVESVDRIVRRPGNRVEVFANFRQRAALVANASGFHLIDRHAVRLPFVYEAWQAFETGLPIISGVAAPMPRPGFVWQGDDIQAGLKLSQIVAAQPWAKQFQAIDVTNFAGRHDAKHGHLKLQAMMDNDQNPFNNPGVEWGRPPGAERFYEPDTNFKLQRIAQEIKKNGPIDDRIVIVTSEPGLTKLLEPAEFFTTTTTAQ